MATQKIDRYIIHSVIGRGGMATVYRAHDPLFDRDVAIKILPHELLHDPSLKPRFEREAKTIALLDHPSIVPVYDYGEHEGQPYLVMRLMVGGSLADRLEKGPIPLEETIQILNDIGSALDAAHEQRIIHRDMKPGNILFDQYKKAFLSDFGIVRFQESHATLTGSSIIGTPIYMSPEQIHGEKYLDGRSDIYSLGVLVFQMLTGSVPYQANTPAQVMMKHIMDPIPNVTEANPNLPTGCDQVIKKAMAKDREERYSSSAEMSKDLQDLVRLRKKPTPTTETVASEKITTAPIAQDATIVSRPKKGEAIRIAPRPVSPTKPKLVWVWVALAGLFLAMILFGGILLIPRILNIIPSQTKIAAQTSPISTSSPTSQVVGLLTTQTPADISGSTPSPTQAIVSPSPVATILGGADMIAFIQEDNIWAINVDGQGLKQLTTDGNQGKANLQWTPGGQSVMYIEGLCIRTVSLEGETNFITCFDDAQEFDAFAISPDGKSIALSVDRLLYILPFDLTRLTSVKNHDQLTAMSTTGSKCLSVRENVFGVDWSVDSQLLQLKITVPEGGRNVEVIRLMRVSSCNQTQTDRLNEIPAAQFTTSNYKDSPTIPSFDWDGQARLVFNDFYRNNGFGDLFIYDTEKRQLLSLNPQIGNKINPINLSCCYRDARWSPDGTYLLFVFQDINTNKTYLYYLRYGLLGSQSAFQPLPLEGMFADPRNQPQPALRPAPLSP
ncbi:MAG: protein kinase [Chloroflexota bacterium]